MVIGMVKQLELVPLWAVWIARKYPAWEGVPEIAPEEELLLRPGGNPVAENETALDQTGV